DAPCSLALRAAEVTVTVVETGDLHGPQSGTMTGPAVPALPLWMCAANALPLRWANVSLNVSFLPLSVPVNVPVAAAGTPFGFGTSRAAVSFADSLNVPSLRTAARPPAASVAVSARTASVTSAFFNLSSLPPVAYGAIRRGRGFGLQRGRLPQIRLLAVDTTEGAPPCREDTAEGRNAARDLADVRYTSGRNMDRLV